MYLLLGVIRKFSTFATLMSERDVCCVELTYVLCMLCNMPMPYCKPRGVYGTVLFFSRADVSYHKYHSLYGPNANDAVHYGVYIVPIERMGAHIVRSSWTPKCNLITVSVVTVVLK